MQRVVERTRGHHEAAGDAQDSSGVWVAHQLRLRAWCRVRITEFTVIKMRFFILYLLLRRGR